MLAGTRALKLKRAVAFDYLDFSSPARRQEACDAELRINRRTAPAIYRRVVPITREPGGALAIDGIGPPVDWCVEMARFDQEALLDRVAARGQLTPQLAEALAASVARLHQTAEVRRDHGAAAGLRWVVAGNAQGFAEQGRGILPVAAADRLSTAAMAAVGRATALLDWRRESGRVRQCHGDLHLRNVVLLDGVPTPFDAVEFNDAISCVDVFYDLAFLLMDLWRRDLRPQANLLLTEYVRRTDDLGGLALLPLFLSCRAAVRAKTSATSARLQPVPAARGELEQAAREYLTLADALLHAPPPTLVAIGGRSGVGKSTLGRALACEVGPVPGAVLLRSDVIRKALFGREPAERLGPDGYQPTVSARVYAHVCDRANAILQRGHAVVVDAAFLAPGQRADIEQVAARQGVPFVGLWLDAPPDVLIARVAARGADASDADPEVVRRQLRLETGAVTWHRLDAAGGEGAVLRDARRLLTVGGAP